MVVGWVLLLLLRIKGAIGRRDLPIHRVIAAHEHSTKGANEFVVVARPRDENIFISMRAILSGYALALLTNRSLVVDAENVESVFVETTALHAAWGKSTLARFLGKDEARQEMERCRIMTLENLQHFVVEDMTAADILRWKPGVSTSWRRPSICSHGSDYIWTVACHETFVGCFPEQPRLLEAALDAIIFRPLFEVTENIQSHQDKCFLGIDFTAENNRTKLSNEIASYATVLSAPGEHRPILGITNELNESSLIDFSNDVSWTSIPKTTATTETLRAVVAANYVLSRCQAAVLPCEKNTASSRLANARAAWRYGWFADQCPEQRARCRAWSYDPVDLELEASIIREVATLGLPRDADDEDNQTKARTSSSNESPAASSSHFHDTRSKKELIIARSYLEWVAWRSKRTVLVYENRVYVDPALIKNDKQQKHVSFIASLARHSNLPNMIYLLEVGSRGDNCYLKSTSSFKLSREMQKIAPKFRVPILSIAKAEWYDQCSIMIPNMYIGGGDVDLWAHRLAELKSDADARPFDARDPRVFWRGAIRRTKEKCITDVGNYARLRAVSLTAADPSTFDVRCVKDDAYSLCLKNMSLSYIKQQRLPCRAEMEYDENMLKVVSDWSTILGDFVSQSKFSQYQYVLNLPGSLRGSYSRNLNQLWTLGSVVALWNESAISDRVVEWYYPALRQGHTHLGVTKASAPTIFADLRRYPQRRDILRKGAQRIQDRYLAPKALGRYFIRVFQFMRSHFGLGPILDDPRRLENMLFSPYADCKNRTFVEIIVPRSVSIGGDSQDERRLGNHFSTVPRTCADILATSSSLSSASTTAEPDDYPSLPTVSQFFAASSTADLHHTSASSSSTTSSLSSLTTRRRKRRKHKKKKHARSS